MLKETKYKLSYRGLLFYLALVFLVFIIYSYNRSDQTITFQEFLFFTNHAIGAFIIGFYLLPRFMYTKKYIRFSVFSILIIAIVVFVEEGILEKIYFPDTKGRLLKARIYDLLDVLPTILILLGAKFAWDAFMNKEQVEKLELSVKENELQFLKTQINPHFLFNNLNNLYAHAIEKSPKTPGIILELSAILRYMLYECNTKFVRLSKELEQLDNFISLSKLQIEGRGKVNFIKAIASENFEIAPLILVVFIENAFKHSASSQTTGITIDIDLTVSQDGKLNFKCRNSYLTQTNTSDLTKGIGLENVKKRLQMLYQDAHQLIIKEQNEIYEVNLEIDLSKTKAP